MNKRTHPGFILFLSTLFSYGQQDTNYQVFVLKFNYFGKVLAKSVDLIIPGHDYLVFSKFPKVKEWVVKIDY
jgi:hypothetical protein